MRDLVGTINKEEDLAPLVQAILKGFPTGAVIGLCGELGAGKTTFVRLFVEVISKKVKLGAPRVISPTYVFHQTYPMLVPSVDHFDLYRLEGASNEALVEIGYFESLERRVAKSGFIFVEWPEKVADQASLELQAVLRLNLHGQSRTFHFQLLS